MFLSFGLRLRLICGIIIVIGIGILGGRFFMGILGNGGRGMGFLIF